MLFTDEILEKILTREDVSKVPLKVAYDYGTGTTRTLSTLIRLNADLCGNAI